jgi:hypothetical protein
MGIKRRMRKMRKKLGGQMRSSADKALLADLEKALRTVRQQMEALHNAVREGLRAETKK